MSKVDISIIICCYNSTKRLPKTLASIANQKVSDEIAWEVVVVDNNSTDNTAEVAQREWDKSGNPIAFKVVSEPTPGLSNARKKGIAESLGEFMLFCDDDNWLEDEYLETAYKLLSKHSAIGVLGGRAYFATDDGVEKPDWFDQRQSNFAVGKQAEFTGEVAPDRNWVYGAGMVVRREAYQKAIKNFPLEICSDRKGKSLSSGGDTELCYKIKLSGYQIWYCDEMQFKHYMPKERLNEEYLKKLIYGISYSTAIAYPYRSRARNYREDLFEQKIFSSIKLLIKHLNELRLKRKKMREFDYLSKKGYALGVFYNFLSIRKNTKKVDKTILSFDKSNII